MNYSKKSFIKEDNTDLHIISTRLLQDRDNIVITDISLYNASLYNTGINIDLSFITQAEKEESLQAINVIINTLTDLRQQMLNHKFKKNDTI